MEVLALGMRQAEVARRLNLTRASVNSAVHQASKTWMPSYETGTLLIQLRDELRRTRTPTEEVN